MFEPPPPRLLSRRRAVRLRCADGRLEPRRARARGRVEPMAVDLVKGIPAGAGLGGGSADAAAVLSAWAVTRGRGRARFRRAVLPATAAGVDARARRGHRADRRSRTARPRDRRARVRVFDPGRLPRVGRARRAARRTRDRRARRLSRPVRQRLEPAAEPVEPRLVDFRDRLEATSSGRRCCAAAARRTRRGSQTQLPATTRPLDASRSSRPPRWRARTLHE